jgi:anti-sigma regulatory factor (Ser/Thr protein kinase)
VQATASYSPHPRAAREARQFAAQTLRTLAREDLEIVVALVVTELVTNSVLHARTPLRVDLTALPDGVRVAVHDASPVRPTRRPHHRDATTGRGLQLVEALGGRWGVDMEPDGKTVWVDVVGEPRAGGGLDGEVTVQATIRRPQRPREADPRSPGASPVPPPTAAGDAAGVPPEARAARRRAVA